MATPTLRPASSSSTHSRSTSVPRPRPQSAAVEASGSPLHRPNANTFKPTKDKANTSSDELIRDLEAKVRKIVEQKRAESDKLRFAVAKKRDEVEKAKLILQDLLKDSDALGLHFDMGEPLAHGSLNVDYTRPPLPAILVQDEEQDAARLQPIASVSRRPVYSKHTNIHELEAKLDRRAKEARVVHRRTLVLEHIKKRLLNERVEVAQITNQLKQVFADLNHETQELQKKEIAAAEAVSQEQTRLTQQKADMAASARKFKRELALRLKWAREKAKFEKYYNDQLQAATAKAVQASHHQNHHMKLSPTRDNQSSAPAGTIATSTSPEPLLKQRRSSTFKEEQQEETIEQMYRDAFQRIGVDTHVEAIDPEEIIRICLSHEELKKELDAKYEESVERIAQLREQIDKARTLAREDIPLSKRGTSQKIETKQLEIATVERQLATVVDQYMFVEQIVRPIKIGLQQILQNVSNATVNINNMTALETSLVESCEEMARLLRASAPSHGAETSNQDAGNAGVASIPEDEPLGEETNKATGSPQRVTRQTEAPGVKSNAEEAPPTVDPLSVVSLDNFTSPYNVRIPAKKREQYFVAGLTRSTTAPKPDDEEEPEDNEAFEVMDRAMVKRISSVVVCTSVGKKPGDKHASEDPVPSPNWRSGKC